MSKRKILAGVLGVCLLASIALPCFAKTVKITMNRNTKETPYSACVRACGGSCVMSSAVTSATDPHTVVVTCSCSSKLTAVFYDSDNNVNYNNSKKQANLGDLDQGTGRYSNVIYTDR